jgi:hypothetical protein
MLVVSMLESVVVADDAGVVTGPVGVVSPTGFDIVELGPVY